MEAGCRQDVGGFDMNNGCVFPLRFVKIGGGHNLNTLEMGSHFTEPGQQHLNRTMVVLPGFGAAVGLFYKNYGGEPNAPPLADCHRT